MRSEFGYRPKVHDWYDWLKDIAVPAIAGLGAVVVGVASLLVARASNRLTKEIAQRDSIRRERQDRVEFGERVRRHAELLRAERLNGTAAPNLELAEEVSKLHSAAAMSSLPGTTDLVRAVADAMRSDWSNGDIRGGMLLAMSQAHALVDIWVDDPDAFIAERRSH